MSHLEQPEGLERDFRGKVDEQRKDSTEGSILVGTSAVANSRAGERKKLCKSTETA